LSETRITIRGLGAHRIENETEALAPKAPII
jgi:hypothetical protein